jgi:hypothetical protein
VFDRFGKTISVSMFAAALLYSAKGVELSIYSTCKRISQKLLRNVQKFLNLIYDGLKVQPFKEIRCNMEELVLQGPDGTSDVRTVNSYPSKVCVAPMYSNSRAHVRSFARVVSSAIQFIGFIHSRMMNSRAYIRSCTRVNSSAIQFIGFINSRIFHAHIVLIHACQFQFLTHIS